jgi:hypothetical protein
VEGVEHSRVARSGFEAWARHAFFMGCQLSAVICQLYFAENRIEPEHLNT